MAQQVNINDSITINPSGIDTSQSSYSTASNNANAYDDINSTNYSTVNCRTGSRAESHVTYTFDVSDLPESATITSVACQVKARVSSTSYISAATLQLYSNTTAKGSSISYRSTTASTYTLTPGTWTRAELNTIRIRATATRGTSNTSRTASIQFYGANLTINYTISGMQYTVIAASSVPEITCDPATQDLMEGEDTTIRLNISAATLDDYTITDNDIDISEQLVRHEVVSDATISADLGTYALVSGSFNSSAGTYFQGLVGAGIDHTKTTTNYYSGGSGTIAVFTYEMGLEGIPANAIIDRVYCEVNGHAESTSNSNEYMCVRLISGNTNLSDETNFKSVGTSNTTVTLETTSTPTIAQLAAMKLQCRLGYYGGAINGATAYVEYHLPASASLYYYTYDITNIDSDHVILISEHAVYIPPEEDPELTYWPITVSSINASTNPSTGTIRVVQGTNQTITITPTDPLLTLALDNGVDVTSQLQGGVVSNTYTVTTQVSGASYGFNLNSSTGYYVSTNNGVSKSASVARLNMDFDTSCLVTIQYINYAEAEYDYGMFGKIDTAVSTTGLTASSGGSSPADSTSNYQYICNSSSDNSSTAKTLTYTVPAGQHFIDIKYGKDDASDANNDSLQWKVLSIESTSGGGEYTYTLTNIQDKHSLIFVFGDVTYYFVTSSGQGCKLFPDGQQVKLPGDGYKLNIVPNSVNDVVGIVDNNVDVTTSLERMDGVDRNNNPVVSYSYTLVNIAATHVIEVTSVSPTSVLYIKENGSWSSISAVYHKENGAWVRKQLTFLSDINAQKLVQGQE